LFDYKTLKKLRACIYLRNIALSSFHPEVVVASCWLPPSLVFFDKDLEFVKSVPVEGKVGAVYELWTKPIFLFNLIDKPLIGIVDTKTLDVRYIKLEKPIKDFSIDPLEKYIIGSSEGGIVIYDIESFKLVKRIESEGIPPPCIPLLLVLKG